LRPALRPSIDPAKRVIRLLGSSGLVVPRTLSSKRPVVVLPGQERSMFARGNFRAAIAAGFSYLLLVPVISYSQELCLATGFVGPASPMILQYDSGICAQEDEATPLAQRIVLARESCETLPRGGWANGICARGDAAASACKSDVDPIQMQLLAMGRRGDTIARIRQMVLEILQNRYACAAWYREVDPDPAATFRSLVFVLDAKASPYVFTLRDDRDNLHFKHPYVASATENAGRNSAIQLNVNGAFFNRSSAVFEAAPDGGPARPGGMRTLRVDSYPGDTPEAQLTAMLHELGHVVGRIPEDTDSLDGQSARNTAEVLRYCRSEIQAIAKRKSH
jgi:hypothetical protein